MSTLTDTLVPSYLSGAWVTPENPSRVTEVHDASTGEVVATVSTDGLDLAGAIEYARETGQRNLRELTIHERALKIKELALYLGEHKDELYELAYKTGANKRDNGVDIDGGIQTMFVYSSKGRRELPNGHVIIDGPTEILSATTPSRHPHLHRPPGRGVCRSTPSTSRSGSAKFADLHRRHADLVKPATPSGYVTRLRALL